ncbi:glycosyltransferase [Gillisia hiemivivida]|uniref:Glycosyltransferase n=1 Tax=Gillisia hiemivivida TaxID=291190 RepID=A0A5C6ZVE1_9FLAO|nr:glycosyltransferase [Gillisia hiemivivida]TXD92849.1 glycosyltransferase [Gillisia hiemivivida]
MKILIIIGSFKMGGAERMSINTGEELMQLGHDVHYIIQQPIFEIPHDIPSEKITVLRKSEDIGAYKILKALFLGIYKETKRINPEITIGFSRFSSFLANFSFNSNIIARLDAYPYRMNRKQRIWADFIIYSPFVKKIVLPSSDMIEAMNEKRPYGIKKYILIPNSIDVYSILEKAEDPCSYNFEYISAMGRFSPQKNFELLINAYSESEIRNRFKLIIIGDGAYRTKLERLVKMKGLSDNIIFTGKLKNPFPIIKNSYFFVNPSKFESFGNVILEALLLGKPVIATNCNYGPADMIQNGENGALIADNDVGELKAKLDEWYNNENMVKRLSNNAHNSALNFNRPAVGRKWDKLITEVSR